MRLSLSTLAFMAVLAVASPAFACPSNELVLCGRAPIVLEDAVDAREVSCGGPIPARAAYDLVHGRLDVLNPGALGGTAVRARDVFTLVGDIPTGAADVLLSWTVSGTISTVGCGGSGCWGNVTMRIRNGKDVLEETASANLYAPEVRPFTRTLDFPLHLVAGTPVEIEFELVGWRPPGGSHVSEGAGNYHFVGLPEGASLVSCQGFVGDPTPVADTSWGRVKASYHR